MAPATWTAAAGCWTGNESNYELQELLTADYRFVINGHSHKPMARAFGETTIINVGTLFRDHQPSVAVIDFATRKAIFHELDGARFTGRTRSAPL
jgi:predicted phosphodiesterase